jgi:transposase
MSRKYRGDKIIVESNGKYIKNYKLSDETEKRKEIESSFKIEKPKEYQQLLPLGRDKQDWHAYHLAKTQEKRIFYQLLSELSQIVPEVKKQETGRPRAKLSDLIFSLGLKLYSNYSGRKSYSDFFHSEKAGFIFKAPGTNTLNDFLNCEATYDLLLRLLTISAMPLSSIETDFAVDSSGFGSYQYERWQKFRFSDNYKTKASRNYVKAHIAIGTTTNIVCSCEISAGNVNDHFEAPKILKALQGNFNPKRISGDKGYSSYRVQQIIQSLGAIPFIAFKDNTNPSENSPKIWIQTFECFKNNREEFMMYYHKRSNVETTFSMIKLRFGEFLKCRNFVAQRNELVMKLICHNICCLVEEMFERNIKVNFKDCSIKFVPRKLESIDETRYSANREKLADDGFSGKP